jgi:hypothetical protein
MTEGGFDPYGGLNLYGEQNLSSSDDEERTTVDDESTQVGRSVSQINARATTPKHDHSDQEEDEDGFQTHRSGMTRSSYMSQDSNDGHSLIDVDKQRQSEFVVAESQEEDQFSDSVVYNNPALAPSTAAVEGVRETVTGLIQGPFGTHVCESSLVDDSGRRIRCVEPSALPQPGVVSTSGSRVTPWLTGKQALRAVRLPPRENAVDRARPGCRNPLQHAPHATQSALGATLGQSPSAQVQGAAASAWMSTTTAEETVFTL